MPYLAIAFDVINLLTTSGVKGADIGWFGAQNSGDNNKRKWPR